MLYRSVAFAFFCCLALLADSVVLRNGKLVEGTYLGGDSRRVRIAVGDDVQSFGVHEISEIRFGSTPLAPQQAKPAASKPGDLTPVNPAAAAPAAESQKIEIPAGTALVIRMIDDVDSSRDKTGQTFRASMDEPVVIDGKTIVPRGADVVAKLVEQKEAGKLTGQAELALDLQSVMVNGRTVDVVTGEVTQRGESRTRQTATRTGGGAAVGAIIGAIAGGGKGAAIGAATGAAAGGAVQVLTRGPVIRIPSETRLTFLLANPLIL